MPGIDATRISAIHAPPFLACFKRQEKSKLERNAQGGECITRNPVIRFFRMSEIVAARARPRKIELSLWMGCEGMGRAIRKVS